MTISPKRLEELAEMARKATDGGGWSEDVNDDDQNVVVADNLYYGDDDENPQDGIRAVIAITDACYDMPDAEKFANACFIAAANPQTILELIVLVERQEKAIESAREKFEMISDGDCSEPWLTAQDFLRDYATMKEVR